jgi:hypothetical protein
LLNSSQIEDLLKNPLLKEALEFTCTYKERAIKTLMPLRLGHQALILATGAFDGVYINPADGHTLVVLGKIETVETESVEIDVENGITSNIVRRTPQSQVIAWDITESMNQKIPVLHKYT